MPTDDDYGRRERLLLHQHPTSQYGQPSSTASPVPASSSSSSSSSSSAAASQQQHHHGGVENIVSGCSIGTSGLPSGLIPTDCYHKQQPQQQQSNHRTTSASSSASSATSTVVRGVSPIACHQERYQINERISQSNEGISEYGARMSLERYDKPIDKHHQQQQQSHYVGNTDEIGTKYGDSSTSCTMQPGVIDGGRYSIGSGQDGRFGQSGSSGLPIGHHGYGIVPVASGRSTASSNQNVGSSLSHGAGLNDRYARYAEASSLAGDQRLALQPNDRFHPIPSDSNDHNSYNHVRTTSSNDERSNGHSAIVNVAKVSAASEYANSSIIATSGLVGLGNSNGVGSGCANGVFTPDTFPSPPSPAPASDRFVPPPPLSPSPSEKYASSQSLAGGCYSNCSNDRIGPNGSPSTRDRYVTSSGSPMAKDHRYSAMSSDRGSVNDRVQSSIHETKDHQQQQHQQSRYGASSTERLLASASPVLSSMQSRESENVRCGLFQVANGLKDANSSGVSSRYSISSDRLVSSSPIHVPVPERFAAGNKTNDRYIGNDSPTHERYHHRSDVSSGVHHDRYSTGICGPGTDRYISASPNPDGAHGRYSSTERSIGTSSTGDNVASRESRRYSTSDRSLEGMCQKYGERGERGCSSSGSPANAAEYSCRFSGFQEVNVQPRYSTDPRFTDIATLQRYGAQSSNATTGSTTGSGVTGRHEQTRSNDRFTPNNNNNNDRYLANSSPGHDNRLVANSDSGRYNCGSSTERLLASSSSPSTSDTGRYHSLYTTSSSCSQTKNDRYGPLSPTPENNQSRNYSQSGTSAKNSNSNANDKYIQVSKSVQPSYSTGERYHQVNNGQLDQFDRTGQGYAIDRYGNPTNSNNGESRYQVVGNNNVERFHSGNSDRYSPARTGSGDKYLSLPKPKDNFVTGRIAASCSTLGVGTVGGVSNVGVGVGSIANGSGSASDRSYGTPASGIGYVPPNAHTPVERYVPQPPPEVLYPDRYVDRYVPPAAHTPTDRYVPAADPGDPYMRRDLGFHHHYRLPPPGYPYHQSHFRFRSFAYTSPGRLGGSPGSSSSSSSTSAQREFSTSPLLRPKNRTSVIELGNSGRQVNNGGQTSCCGDGSRNCCPTVRRSLPPGALPSIPNQSAHSSWQPSPGSGTTGTSTVSSSGTDGESTQSIGLYAVGGEAPKSEKSTTTSVPSPSPPVVSSNPGPVHNSTGPNITRSVSAPAGPRPIMQPTISTNSTNAATSQRPRLRRNMSRTEAIKNYIKRETATFFGVDEDSEVLEKQRWLDRRRRMASRKYGALLPEYKPPDPDITRDVPDSTEMPEGVTLRRWQQPVRRKDSVARMTLSGLHYMVETLTKQRPREKSETGRESRSFPPSVISSISQADVGSSSEGAVPAEDDDDEETFFQRPPPPPPPPAAPSVPEESETPAGENGEVNFALSSRPEAGAGGERDQSEELVRFTPHKEDRTVVDGQQVRRPRAITRDHYTSRTRSWRRSRQPEARVNCDPATGSQQEAGVILQRELSGGTRISPSTIDRVFDNSNRRQYGMGIVGRFFGRSFRKSVAHKPDVRKQLDDIEDHRPYFTYWITTVQVFILIISLACYGFGPVGIDLNRRSGLVLVTSLSLQQVDYDEPANFWLGPRAADLIHLGAKFGPCMRRDIKILNEIDVWRERERDTACCIRNDDSGCVQSSKADCSNTISTWKKWGPGDSGPGGRISGSVCGLDPKFCDAPASIAPYEWPDDITKWPICRKTNPFSQRFRSHNSRHVGNDEFPIGRYKDKMAEHMVCEVIGHPCCIGIHGMCRITTKEYCDFVHGYFHEEASLCSQVECLHDVCGMMPFLHPEWPDQFYRLFTTTFLHAGIFHLAITLLVQYFLMRDLEKLTGSLRIALIYFTGGLAGNLASAIFIPHRAEVGPAGAHFALLATLVVEVLNCWPMLKHPRRALSKLIMILVGLLMLGVLPWIDNYAHLFGFIFGFLAAYALMPFISFGHYDRRRKILLIWICLVLILGLFALLLAVFYNVPVYDCEICKLFNCIPFTRDFCASQNINFKKEEPV